MIFLVIGGGGGGGGAYHGAGGGGAGGIELMPEAPGGVTALESKITSISPILLLLVVADRWRS